MLVTSRGPDRTPLLEVAMPAYKDITGQRFGRLVAERFVEFRIYGTKSTKGRAAWVFRCDCGAYHTMLAQTAKERDFQGYGCPRCVKEFRAREKCVHGWTGMRLHRIWIGIRARCNNQNDTSYSNYGARGIFVSPAWDDFETFLAWSKANNYADNLELDRIDNNGPYAPDNCRWVNHTVNARNTRRTRRVILDGEEMAVTALAEKSDFAYTTILGRLNRGMSPKEALTRPSRTNRVRWLGRQFTFTELARETGIPRNTLYGRIKRDGMTVEQAVTLPRDTWATRRLRQH